MLDSRQNVIKECERIIKNNFYKQKKMREFYKEIGKYNIDASMVSNFSKILVGTKDNEDMRYQLDNYSDYFLFCFIEVSHRLNFTRKTEQDYFTVLEIDLFSKEKGKKTKENLFPLELEAVQIAQDQYIAKFSVKELMKLRNNKSVVYNANTQRTLTRYKVDGVDYYKITINKKSVNSIKNFLEKEIFIPNTITLNISEQAEIYYNNNRLIINEETSFDIIDGYHRFVAMGQCYDSDNSFDYPIELRIVQFSEKKAKQFIYQEDKKTKMSKTDSDSFNQYSVGNFIAGRINQNSDLLSGLIIKNGMLDSAILGETIDKFNEGNEYNNKIKFNLYKKFQKYLENCVIENILDIELKYNYNDIYKICYCFFKNKDVKTLHKLLSTDVLIVKGAYNSNNKRIEKAL